MLEQHQCIRNCKSCSKHLCYHEQHCQSVDSFDTVSVCYNPFGIHFKNPNNTGVAIRMFDHYVESCGTTTFSNVLN
jgi:hypothetical protein